MDISVIGAGYVGCSTGASLANNNHNVYIIDQISDKLDLIKKGCSPVYEPGLSSLLKKNLSRIITTSNLSLAVRNSEVVIIAVGTPSKNGSIDLSSVRQVAEEIGACLKNQEFGYKVIVVKSTVLPGTTMDIVQRMILGISHKDSSQIGFCMNPEFLRVGHAVEDVQNPDRIILGVTDAKVTQIMREVYSQFDSKHFIVTNPTTSEMIKYTANSYLALNISYANQISRVCEKLEGVDSEEVFKGVFWDRRISPIYKDERIFPPITTYLSAGCGFGGSCFPKDVEAFTSFARNLGLESPLLESILEVNQNQINHVFNMGIRLCSKQVKNVAILGTAFKPETDDIRESSGLMMAHLAFDNDISVNIHDYQALEKTKKILGEKAHYYHDPLEAISNVDVVYVTTKWPQYLDIKDRDFENNMKEHTIMIDSRSLFKHQKKQPWRFRVGVQY